MTTRGPMLFVVVARPRKGGGEMDSRVRRTRLLRWYRQDHYLLRCLLCFNDRAACARSGSVQVVVITALL